MKAVALQSMLILLATAANIAPARAQVDSACSIPPKEQLQTMSKAQFTVLVCSMAEAQKAHLSASKAASEAMEKISTDEKEAQFGRLVEALTHSAQQYRCLATAQAILRVSDRRFGDLPACAN
jgi:hypothetical protein